MTRWGWVLPMACIGLFSVPAQGFSIGSSITDFCHERITYSAFRAAHPLADRLGADLDAARDEAFVLFGDYLAEQMGITLDDDFDRLVITSLFVGVRYPDQGAFSTFDLGAMRAIHLDQGHQAGHFLRDTDHDGAGADAAAVVAGREFIEEHAKAVIDDLRAGGGTLEVVEVKFYLEFYGSVKLQVWGPLFRLGEAVHALQDSFAHAVRSEDGRQIIAVANFVEPLLDGYKEARDGPMHSNVLDECNHPRVQGHATWATQATAALFAAVREGAISGETTALDAALDTWLGYREGCDHSNAYCDSAQAEFGATDPTTAPLSCGATGSGWWMLWALVGLRRRRCAAA